MFLKSYLNSPIILNLNFFRQVFKNLQIDLEEKELLTLFYQIDQNQNNQIDIDELIFYITSNDHNNLRGLAQSAVLKIRSSRKLKIEDLSRIFSALPQHFSTSFFRNLYQKNLNIPSSGLIPKVTEQEILSNDFRLVHQSKSNNSKSLYEDHVSNLIEINLLEGIKIPMPDEASFGKKRVKVKKVYVGFFN